MDTKDLAWRIRRHAVEMTHRANSSHIGAVLSVADIVAVLYGCVLQVFPDDPQNALRDRFVLSKGHAGVAVYAALAECGFFPPALLDSYCADGSDLSGHVSHKKVPGVELTTGSLGHGLPVAAGMALAGQLNGAPYRVFAVLGDGECQEGAVWEAALLAAQHKLDNLCVLIDCNRLQGLGFCSEVLQVAPLGEKFERFGWAVREIDGHDHEQIAAATAPTPGRPLCIVANTVKGKGISFMENQLAWHYRSPQGEDYDQALRELEAQQP